jgi:hypothetical protein
MKRRPDPAKLVAEFNERVKVGGTVAYSEVIGMGIPRLYRTTTPAQVLSGHTAVVWLDGKSGCVAVEHCTPKSVDYLASESCRILVVDGHVDIEDATRVFADEGSGDFPAPRHSWMHFTKVPEGEDAEWWRQECARTEKGAQPVTLSIREH